MKHALANSPMRRKSGGHRIIDWVARDAAIAASVRKAAQTLRLLAYPVRLTKTTLVREAEFLWVWPKKIYLLPETALALNQNAEDRIEFAKRRIEAAAQRLEHFTFYCRLDLQSLNHALALSGVM